MRYLPRMPYSIALIMTLGVVMFYHFGGALWRPVKARLFGERAIGQVIAELDPLMRKRFQNLERLTNGEPITILAFKEEQRIELWKWQNGTWEFLRSYPFTGFSGVLGPKLREGDGQIPEGVYEIESLNPNSSYHLSMKVAYPNSFDRKMAVADGRERLGYDIFIHGSNATVGCIPIGNENIEEVFYMIAKNGFRKTKVIISPLDFRDGKQPPEVDEIDWESNLYKNLSKILENYPMDKSKQRTR